MKARDFERADMEGQNLYSLMEYSTDGILHLKHIIEPPKPFNDYKEGGGDTGLCRFRGYPGRWPYIIHAVGRKFYYHILRYDSLDL